MKNKEKILKEIEEREKYKDNCFACNHPLSNHKKREEDKAGWNCTFPDCSCPFTIEDIREYDIELKATLKGYELCEKEKDEEFENKINLTRMAINKQWGKILRRKDEEFKKFIEELNMLMTSILNNMPVYASVGYRTEIGDKFRDGIDKISSKYQSPQPTQHGGELDGIEGGLSSSSDSPADDKIQDDFDLTTNCGELPKDDKIQDNFLFKCPKCTGAYYVKTTPDVCAICGDEIQEVRE